MRTLMIQDFEQFCLMLEKNNVEVNRELVRQYEEYLKVYNSLDGDEIVRFIHERQVRGRGE